MKASRAASLYGMARWILRMAWSFFFSRIERRHREGTAQAFVHRIKIELPSRTLLIEEVAARPRPAKSRLPQSKSHRQRIIHSTELRTVGHSSQNQFSAALS